MNSEFLLSISKQYLELFCSCNFTKLRWKNLEGEMGNSSLRSLCWKVFLGCLPREMDHHEWVNVILVHRREYSSLLKQYLVDPHDKNFSMDPVIDNPLSQNEKNPWLKFFQNAELEKEIDQDIKRTYPEKEFFQNKDVREMMLRILFIYARQVPQLSYKQGMHELLAPIVYLVDKEKLNVDERIFLRSSANYDSVHNEPSMAGSPDDDTRKNDTSDSSLHDEKIQSALSELNVILDPRYVEHDAFTMFSHLMKIVKPWFQQEAISSPPSKGTKNKKENIFIFHTEEKSAPIVDKCKFIQNHLLRGIDHELYVHLQRLNIEPQIYMLRWIRVLLAREFHIEDVFLLWDAIFAFDTEATLIDYICVAMLIYIRSEIIGQDYSFSMRRLFKYPPVENVHAFIKKALLLQQQPIANSETPLASRRTTLLSIPSKEALVEVSTTPKRRTTISTTSTTSDSVHSKSPSRTSKNYTPNQPATKILTLSKKLVSEPHRKSSSESPQFSLSEDQRRSTSSTVTIDNKNSFTIVMLEKESLQRELSRLRNLQTHVSNRLERLIFSLQCQISDRQQIDTENLLVTVAELKQVKDILGGHLTIDTGDQTTKLLVPNSDNGMLAKTSSGNKDKNLAITSSHNKYNGVLENNTLTSSDSNNMDPLGLVVFNT